MKIRKATREDIRDLSRLNRVVQKMHAEAYPDIFKPAEDDDFSLEFFAALLEEFEFTIFLAEEDQPVGYIVLQVRRQPENPFMYAWQYVQIDQIGVLPEIRGKGVGKALMSQAEKLAEQEGLPLIRLASWGFNTEAHEFFHSQGFKNHILYMWKKLDR